MATVAGQLPEQHSAAEPRPMPWLAIGWFTALVVIAYFPTLKHLVEQWSTDEDVGHGFFVPVVAGYIAWQRRNELATLPWKPAWWGVAILLWAAFQGYVGSLGAELFLQRTAVLITIVGILLVLGGKELVKTLAFPLLLLPF